MYVKSPKYRKAISEKQKKVLIVIAKYRYSSVPVLAEYLGKDKSTVYECLKGLVDQVYVKQIYDKSYKLRLLPASYCLDNKGVRYLREQLELPDNVVGALYKVKAASEPLVAQTLQASKVWLQLNKQYPDTFTVNGKTDLCWQGYHIKPYPDLKLTRKRPSTVKPNQYYIELIPSYLSTWKLHKRMDNHEMHFNTEYEGEDYPVVLFITGNANTERRILRRIEDYYYEIPFWTTTIERFESGELKTWWCEPEFDGRKLESIQKMSLQSRVEV